MKYDACTDEELIERLRQGETEITDYILEKYKEVAVQCTPPFSRV